MLNDKTKLIHGARSTPHSDGGYPVNPPVMRASTILFETHDQWQKARNERETKRVLSYGARGTESLFYLESLIAEMERGYRSQLFPTGLAALSTVLLHYAQTGKHILISDGIYAPVRKVCELFMKKYGVDFDFVHADCSDFAQKIRPETNLLLCESPSSVLYEIIDLPSVCNLAHKHGIDVAIDNTYSSGYFFHPLEHGADISIIAATKYLSGHSDVVMGVVVCKEKQFKTFGPAAEALGMTTSPDDAYLVLRGIRTLDLRMRTHERNAIQIAHWLEEQPLVCHVYHPALSYHPGHQIFERDFLGSNGMVTFELVSFVSDKQAVAFIDELKLFGIGASWGGFESLATLTNPTAIRSQSNWGGHGPFVRMHIGLEDVRDLIEDLQQGFRTLDNLVERTETNNL